MTVRELLQRMSSSELSEWRAYYEIEPFGEERADLRAGTIASPLVNMWKGKKGARTKPSDWIMKFGALLPQDPEEMKMLLKALAARGGQRSRKPKKKKAKRSKPNRPAGRRR